MKKNTRIVAVHVPGEGCYCPSCYKEQPHVQLDQLIELVVTVSGFLGQEQDAKEKRLKHFHSKCLQGIRSLWTQNGLNRIEAQVISDAGMRPYDPRFPAQPMSADEARIWQLACYECPAEPLGLLPPGDAILQPPSDSRLHLAGTMMACRGCKSWQGRLLECAACRRILS